MITRGNVTGPSNHTVIQPNVPTKFQAGLLRRALLPIDASALLVPWRACSSYDSSGTTAASGADSSPASQRRAVMSSRIRYA